MYATQAKRVTDEMFIAAARAVAEQVTPAELDVGLIYPPQSEIFDTELHAATRVAEVIFARNLARAERPASIEEFIRQKVYSPSTKQLSEQTSSSPFSIIRLLR